MTRSTLRSIAAIAAMLAAATAAADLDEGIAALDQEDYERARLEFEPLAESGDPVAQYNLAVLYQQGLGIAKSRKRAVEWFRKAADQGDADAAFALGAAYHAGEGARRDLVESYMWMRISWKRGNETAKGALHKITREMTVEQILEARRRADEVLASN